MKCGITRVSGTSPSRGVIPSWKVGGPTARRPCDQRGHVSPAALLPGGSGQPDGLEVGRSCNVLPAWNGRASRRSADGRPVRGRPVRDGILFINVDCALRATVSSRYYERSSHANFRSFVLPVSPHFRCIVGSLSVSSSVGGSVGRCVGLSVGRSVHPSVGRSVVRQSIDGSIC